MKAGTSVVDLCRLLRAWLNRNRWSTRALGRTLLALSLTMLPGSLAAQDQPTAVADLSQVTLDVGNMSLGLSLAGRGEGRPVGFDFQFSIAIRRDR